MEVLLDDFDSLLYRMGRLMSGRHTDFLADTGLSVPQYMMLRVIDLEGEMRISDIASTLGVKNPAASMLVQSLEEQSYVERTHDSSDQRVVRVSPTAEGRERFVKAEQERRRFLQKHTSALTEDELRALIRILAKMADTISGDST